MEIDNFRKKAYLQTLYSSYIEHKPTLLPQWISELEFAYISAYEFACYNLEEEETKIISREYDENEIIAIDYRSELSENKCEIFYVFREEDRYYLAHRPQENTQNILIYQNVQKDKQKFALDFIDQLFEKSEIKSQKSMLF